MYTDFFVSFVSFVVPLLFRLFRAFRCLIVNYPLSFGFAAPSSVSESGELSIVNYQLSIINCPLSIINCQLSIMNYELSIIHCQLSILKIVPRSISLSFVKTLVIFVGK